MAIIITKPQAASRLLDSAIHLFFSNGDAVAIHTLAASAANLFSDLAERSEVHASWRTHLREESGLSRKALTDILHLEWNFFKHAERNPTGTLSFNELLSEDFMFMAVLDCGELLPTTLPMQVFQIWYIAAHPERFADNEQLFLDAQRLLPSLSKLSREQQITKGALFLSEHCRLTNSSPQ